MKKKKRSKEKREGKERRRSKRPTSHERYSSPTINYYGARLTISIPNEELGLPLLGIEVLARHYNEPLVLAIMESPYSHTG